MKTAIPILAALIGALIVALSAACAASDSGASDIERRATALNKALMCPVCPGESIDQSQNPLAVQMRAVVRDMLEDGLSEDEIKDFFVERYGPSVLMQPPSEGFGLAAWIVPPIGFGLAVVALLLTLKWMRMSADASAAQRDEESERERDAYVSRIDAAISPDANAPEAGSPDAANAPNAQNARRRP